MNPSVSLPHLNDFRNTTPKVVMGNCLELLLESLCRALSTKRAAPPQRTLLVFPSNRIKEFIVQGAMKKWGALHGVHFAVAENAFALLFTLAQKKELQLPSQATLALRIEEILHKEGLFFARGEEKKIAPFARKLAQAFFTWGWEGGEIAGEEGRYLLQKLQEKVDFPSTLLPLLCPPRIQIDLHLFGIAEIPKAALPLLSLFETTLYFFSPTPHYFGDVLSLGSSAKLDELFRQQKISLTERTAFDTIISDTNPELANLVGFLKPLYNQLIEHPFAEAYREIEGSSTLAILQNDIYHLTKTEEIEEDDSLQCVEAACPLVEIELLRRQIEKWIQNKEATPTEILVLVPNLPLYAPYIELAFSNPLSPLGFQILDIRGTRRNSPLQTMEMLFSLREERFSKEAVLALVTSPHFAKSCFGLREEEFRLLHFLVEHLQIQWGYDRKMRQEILGEENIEERGTWQGAFQGLLENLPYKNSPISLEEVEAVGKWIHLLEELAQDLVLLEQEATLYEIQQKVAQLLAKYLEPHEEIDGFLKKLQKIVYKSDTLFSFASVRELLGEESYSLLSPPPKPRISFHPLAEGTILPRPILCVVGLDEESFPKTPPSAHIIRKIFPDQKKQEKEKFLFLQTLLSARKKLYLSYCCFDAEGKPLSYSLLLTSLFERISGFVPKRVTLPLPLPRKTSSPTLLPKKVEEKGLIAIEDLSKVARHPIQYYAQHVLGIFLEEKRETAEFILPAKERALLARECLQGKSIDAILQEALAKNRLPAALFYESAKREIIGEIDSLQEALSAFSLSAKDLSSLHFLKGGAAPLLRGKIDLVTKEGLFIPKNFSVAEVWKHLPQLFLLGIAGRPTTLLFKEGCKKEFTLRAPEENLALFLTYFKAAKNEISPLLPERIAPLLKGDKEKFLSLATSAPFFPDPYLALLSPNLSHPWELYVEALWKSLTP